MDTRPVIVQCLLHSLSKAVDGSGDFISRPRRVLEGRCDGVIARARPALSGDICLAGYLEWPTLFGPRGCLLRGGPSSARGGAHGGLTPSV